MPQRPDQSSITRLLHHRDPTQGQQLALLSELLRTVACTIGGRGDACDEG
jgi:hypothetical protein